MYGKGSKQAGGERMFGGKTLEFHEGKHGDDMKAYIDAHEVPQFFIILPATEAEFKVVESKLKKEVDNYNARIEAYSIEMTDNLKTP